MCQLLLVTCKRPQTWSNTYTVSYTHTTRSSVVVMAVIHEQTSNSTTTASSLLSGNEDSTLHKAVCNGPAAVAALLKSKPELLGKIDARDSHGVPALHYAVHLRDTETIKVLLAYGASPVAKNGGGWSALQEAIASKSRENVRILFIAQQTYMQEQFKKRLPALLDVLESVCFSKMA